MHWKVTLMPSREVISILALSTLLVGGGMTGAHAVSWGSCALGANCGSEGCWTQGHGTPASFGDTPECIFDPEEPVCYVCLYSQPSYQEYGVCSETADMSFFICDTCRIGSWPGSLPECPYSP